MKKHSLILGALAAGCVAVPRHASAQVSTNDFNALRDTVQTQGQEIQELIRSHQQDQQVHEADQKKIESLEQQLGETGATATNAQAKAEEVARVQSAYPAATGSMAALHN